MNAIKKYAGLIWMLLGPLAIYYLVKTLAGYLDTMGGIYHCGASHCCRYGNFWILCLAGRI